MMNLLNAEALIGEKAETVFGLGDNNKIILKIIMLVGRAIG